jgi:HEAT repeat protein
MTTFEKVEGSLLDKDEEVRRQAVESLLGSSGEDALRLMIRAMGDESWRVRKAAVEAVLTYRDSPRAIEALVHALHADDNAGLRNSAVETLIRMGEEGVPALLRHVMAPNDDVRKFVMDVLGGIGDPRAVPALVQAMDDSNENVRSAAAENLGLIGSEDAVESLVSSLRRDDLQLRYSALRALASIGQAIPPDALAPILDKPLLKKALYGCLGNQRDLQAVDLLLEGLADRSQANRETAAASLMKIYNATEDSGFRDEVALRVGRITRHVDVEMIIHDLQTRDLNKRISIVQLLGLIGDASAVTALLGAASEESVEPFAQQALVLIGPPAVEVLLAEFSGLGEGPRRIACLVLGEVGRPAAAGALNTSTEDASPGIRAAAATALGQLEAIGYLPSLTALLDDPAQEVQDAAVRAIVRLSKQHGPEVLERIIPVAGAGKEAIRANAVRVLGEMASEGGLERISLSAKDESPVVRQAALVALGRIGFQRFEEAFQLALTDESPDVRKLTAELWGGSELPRAAENLKFMLQDEDLWVRCAAIRALGNCGDAAAFDAIRKTLGGENGIVDITAFETLISLGGNRAIEPLMEALRHDDPEVIRVALQGLERLGPGVENEALSEALSGLLGNADPDIRLAVVRFVFTRRLRKVLPALVEHRGGEKDISVREMMRHAIERLREPESSREE